MKVYGCPAVDGMRGVFGSPRIRDDASPGQDRAEIPHDNQRAVVVNDEAQTSDPKASQTPVLAAGVPARVVDVPRSLPSPGASSQSHDVPAAVSAAYATDEGSGYLWDDADGVWHTEPPPAELLTFGTSAGEGEEDDFSSSNLEFDSHRSTDLFVPSEEDIERSRKESEEENALSVTSP